MKSVRQQWVLDVQWSDVPEAVEKEVRALWRNDDRLHNDVCIYKWRDEDWSWDERHPERLAGNPYTEVTPYPAIEAWLVENKVPFGEEVWIHWWW